MHRLFRHVRLDPLDPGAPAVPAAQVTPGGGTPDQRLIDRLSDVKSLDLDAPVRIGGKLFTAQQILDQQKELEEARTARANFQEVEEALGTIYRPDGTPPREQGEKAIRKLLTHRGFSPEKIEAYIQDVYGEEDADPDEPAARPPGEDKRRERHEQVTRDLLDRTMRGQLVQQVETGGTLKEILDGVRRRDGDEAADALRGDVMNELAGAMNARLRELQAQHGEFRVSWIDEHAPKVAKAIAQRMMRLTGDPRKLGVTEGAVGTTAAQYESVLNREPLKRPSYEGQSAAAIEKAMSAFHTDRLVRAAAQMQGGRGGGI